MFICRLVNMKLKKALVNYLQLSEEKTKIMLDYFELCYAIFKKNKY